MSADVTQSSHATHRTSIYVDGYEHSNPIPAACRVDDVVYSSIIHGVDRSSDEGPGSLEQQAELMFRRLRTIVEASGGGLGDVVKVTMWMRDRAERDVVNRFWLQLFPDAGDRPARQTVNAQLDGEQLIQCDFVAVIHEGERGEQRS